MVHRRLALLAEAYGNMGQAEEGLRLIAEALAATVHNRGERRGESELYRLKGELLLKAREADGRTARASAGEVERVAGRMFSEGH